MTLAQKKILDEAAKTKLKNEIVLSGGGKYINPIRKPNPKEKNDFLANYLSDYEENINQHQTGR